MHSFFCQHADLRCGIVSSGDGYLVMEGKEFNKRVRDPHTNEVDFKEFSWNGKMR